MKKTLITKNVSCLKPLIVGAYKPAALAVFAMVLLSAGNLIAQETDEQENTSEPITAFEEIIVTGTKRETNLMETALAISAFSQDDLNNAGVLSLASIGDMIPNLQIGTSPTDSGVQIAIRGLSSNNFTELGDPTVAVHFDGLYSPRPQAGLALMHDVERTEVARGPQGTLFGRNSTAGSVNVISKRPDMEGHSGNIEFAVGLRNQVLSKGWLNLPVNDKIAVRASYVWEQQDAWLNQSPDYFDLAFDGNNDGDYEDSVDIAADGIPNVDQRRNQEVGKDQAYTAQDRYGFRLSGRYLINDNAEWNLIYDHFQNNSPGDLSLKDCEKAEGTYFACDHAYDDVKVNVPGIKDMTIQSIRSILEWDITDSIVMEHRVAYSNQSRFQQSDSTVGDYVSPLHPAYGFGRSSVNGEFDFGALVRDYDLLDSLGFVTSQTKADGTVSLVTPVHNPFDDLAQTTRYSNYDSLVTELQFKSQGDSSFQWIAGLFYMKEQNEIQFEVEIPFCCAAFEPLAEVFVQPDRSIESTAAFVQFDYQLIENLNITFGTRYTTDTKQDVKGSIHSTTGFAAPNPGLYFSPDFASRGINPLSYVFLGNGSTDYYQSDDLTDADGSLNPDFTNRVKGTDNSHKKSWDKVTWKLGFDWEINEDWFTYGYVATGFKAGGFGDAIFVCDSCGATNTFDYDPETNTTYELGIKTSLLDNRLKLLANVFLSDYDDLQQSRYDNVTNAGDEREVQPGFEDENNPTFITCSADATKVCEVVGRDIGTFLTRNIGKARTSGVEFEFDWLPWEGGRIYGWVAYLNAEITDYDTEEDWYCLDRAILGLTPCVEQVEDEEGNLTRPISFAGNKLPWSPERSATLNMEHRFYADNGLVLSPFMSISWQDELFFDNGNFDEGPYHSGQEAVTTVNLALRLWSEENNWSAEVFGYNVTDELIRNWGDRGLGFMKASFAAPRHVGMKFSKSF